MAFLFNNSIIYVTNVGIGMDMDFILLIRKGKKIRKVLCLTSFIANKILIFTIKEKQFSKFTIHLKYLSFLFLYIK